MCSPPPLCTLCWSATRPRISKMPNFCLIYSRQCISCYPEKRICCMSSGWPRRRWRRPWRGSGISWSKTRSPPTSGGGRSPSKSASWSAIYRRKILRKYIFLYKEQFLFYFLCCIWFWLHLICFFFFSFSQLYWRRTKITFTFALVVWHSWNRLRYILYYYIMWGNPQGHVFNLFDFLKPPLRPSTLPVFPPFFSTTHLVQY